MEGILKVTPEQLISASQEFEATGGSISNLTSQMTAIVTGLTSVWEGEAATLYQSKFQGLQDDIERLHGMIREHAQDLVEMANIYTTKESEVSTIAEALSSDVIV